MSAVTPTLDPNEPQNGSWYYPAGSGVEISVSHLGGSETVSEGGSATSDTSPNTAGGDTTAAIYGSSWTGTDSTWWTTTEYDEV